MVIHLCYNVIHLPMRVQDIVGDGSTVSRSWTKSECKEREKIRPKDESIIGDTGKQSRHSLVDGIEKQAVVVTSDFVHREPAQAGLRNILSLGSYPEMSELRYLNPSTKGTY